MAENPQESALAPGPASFSQAQEQAAMSAVGTRRGAFEAYSRHSRQLGTPATAPSVSPVLRLSRSLPDTFRACNAEFQYAAASATPRRVLTVPAEGVANEGADNANNDLVLGVNDLLASNTGRRFVVLDLLGCGTFGQVVKCRALDSGEVVAVKVIKNHPAYHHQARVEVGILQQLNGRTDPEDQQHIVRLREYFVHARHLCLVFELLHVNLYELLKQNNFRGLSTSLLRLFLGQLLTSLRALRRAGVIHCDIKPENVLLKSLHSGEVKLIDFGSACADGRTVYSYIQSRFYRAPEVVLGAPYGPAIDMWSLGAVAAELFLGLPLFPGASEFNLLQRITEALGPLPDSLLSSANHAPKFYRRGSGGAWAMLSQTEHEAVSGKPAALGKRYFAATSLAELMHAAPFRRGLAEAELMRERNARAALLDWLSGVMVLDPAARWTPAQASAHPFITGAAFEGPWTPPPEAPPMAPPQRSAPLAPAFHVGSPMPSPAAAPPSWPGGALPVGQPHSPAAQMFGGFGGVSPSTSADALAQFASPEGAYRRMLVQQHAAHMAAQQTALYGAPGFGVSPAAMPLGVPFGYGSPHAAGAGWAPGAAQHQSRRGGLPPVRRGSAGARELSHAPGGVAPYGSERSPRSRTQAAAMRRRASEGVMSLVGAGGGGDLDVDRPSESPSAAHWDPAFSDALLEEGGEGEGSRGTAAQRVAALAQAHAQAHFAQLQLQAHAAQFGQWPGLTPAMPFGSSLGQQASSAPQRWQGSPQGQ